MRNRSCQAIAVVSLTAALSGCAGTGSAPDVTSSSAGQSMAGSANAESQVKALISGLPGLPNTATPVKEPEKVFRGQAPLVVARYGAARRDPFALKASEQKFEISQNTERIMGSMGDWSSPFFEPPKERDPNAGLINEPQPYRRLMGIIVGESVYAIMDQGDGQPLIIRPGMKIPNSDWVVVSIDEEKAVLRRRGNKLPHQVVVRLESPPGGVPGMGSSGNPGPGNGAPGPGGMGKGPGVGRPGGGKGLGGGGMSGG